MKLKQIKSIKAHNDIITSLSIFPISENIISVGYENDKSIKIWNKDFILIQNIEKAHETSISDIDIKDENNFATSCWFSTINIWNKNEKDNKFYLKETIKAHLYHTWISKIIFKLNGTLISCGQDKTIRIWEICNNKYQCVTILNHNGTLKSILLLEEEKNIVSAGNDGTIFWNMEYYTIDKNIKEALCYMTNALKRIGKDNIIVSGGIYHKLKVINIHQKIIIREIDNSFQCYDICEIPSFRLFFVCGGSKNIKIYREDNFESVQIITNAHNNFINGFLFLDNDIFLTYSYQTIKIWKLEIN